MKRLILVALFALVLPIYGQEAARSQGGVAQHAPSYFSRVFSAENLPNLGLLVAGVAGIFVAIWTLSHMRESSERQLRAYVFVETADILEGKMFNPPLPAKAGFPWVLVTIKNSGQTPAYDIFSWLQIAVATPATENTLAVPTLQRISANNLGPGSGFSKNLWFDRPLTPPEITDIAKGARGIYAYGRIEYRDAFDVKRFTNFRVRYNGIFPPLPNSKFNFCNSGNDAS